ncbi:hypothetical protein TGGT1_365100 [Toxoplasma gondii GT1]|uniref:Uncharacterized protein n=1 Tax=Toxoplasma gondii (strain ATCC 50853 / GT1) TaxID=507601 RepID=S7WC46_TOXGG|nr:hypothetical protein TGGT1_365100 [Toxoplasma gondii GT1]
MKLLIGFTSQIPGEIEHPERFWNACAIRVNTNHGGNLACALCLKPRKELRSPPFLESPSSPLTALRYLLSPFLSDFLVLFSRPGCGFLFNFFKETPRFSRVLCLIAETHFASSRSSLFARHPNCRASTSPRRKRKRHEPTPSTARHREADIPQGREGEREEEREGEREEGREGEAEGERGEDEEERITEETKKRGSSGGRKGWNPTRETQRRRAGGYQIAI